MKNTLFQLKKNIKGVSLLELIVAMGIFVIVSLLVNGIYINITGSQKQSIASQVTQESLRFTFEMMSKEMRTAQGLFGGSDCAPGVPFGHFKIFNGSDNNGATTTHDLYFKNKNGKCVVYQMNNNSLQIQRGTVVEGMTTGTTTPNELKINDLTFIINDNVSGAVGTSSPSVTMMVEAEMLDGPKQNIKMQTTISSREYVY